MGVDQLVVVAQEQFVADQFAGRHSGVDEVAIRVDHTLLPIEQSRR